jgi:TonB-dependent receptor-like protein/carboxypeptidase family protein
VELLGLLLAAALRVRVLDPSGAAVPRAAVTLRCAEARAREAETGASGEAAFSVVDPAACALFVEARGFEPVSEPQIAPDASGLVAVRLALARREEKVTVGEDTRESLARARSFSQVLAPEEIASLPDDPEEMENELRRRSGPGAVLRVNGFSGGRLPPKSQIRHIRIQTNRFAAEYHEGGHPGIDIVTKPGLGSWRTAVGGGLRDGAWASRPPLASAGGAQTAHRVSVTLDGPLRKDKTSLSLQLQSRDATDVSAVTALSPGAPATVRPTQRKLDLQGRVEHAWGKTQTARAEVQHDTFDRDGVGTGGLVLPERGYADDRAEDLLRLSNTGVTLGSWATDTRLQLRREATTWTPRTGGPAVDVLGAFSSGGATLAGARRTRSVELGQDLSRAWGRHAVRAGLLYEGAFVRTDERRNAEGTYTFASLADWQAQRPLLFTQRTGDPRVAVDLHRIGVYAQDDWRPTDAVAVNGGVRYEAQSFVDGASNFAPRLGLTWALRPTLTLRAGAGRFFDWLEADPVAQVRGGDGTHTHELSIDAPVWTDPFASGAPAASTTRRWALASHLVQPRTTRLSFGLERSFGPVRMNTEYAYERGAAALRARNLARNGGRLFEVRAEGRARAHTVRTDVMLGAPGRRAGGMVGYMFRSSRNDSDGPLALPADDTNLAAEWGPAADDVRHRLFGFGHWRVAGRLRLSGQLFAQSGAPWDAITGRDDNGDTLASDRPAGTTRNAERGGWTVDTGLRLTWDFGFGGRRQNGPRGPQMIAIRLGGDEGPPDVGGGPDDQRYGVQLYALAGNVLNHLNVARYGNVVGSPLFGRAVEAVPGRRVEIGARFRF